MFLVFFLTSLLQFFICNCTVKQYEYNIKTFTDNCNNTQDGGINGIVISHDDTRYTQIHDLLTSIGLNIKRHIPISYTSSNLEIRYTYIVLLHLSLIFLSISLLLCFLFLSF